MKIWSLHFACSLVSLSDERVHENKIYYRYLRTNLVNEQFSNEVLVIIFNIVLSFAQSRSHSVFDGKKCHDVANELIRKGEKRKLKLIK